MIRQSPRLFLRASRPLYANPTRRFLSTAPPSQKSRSWKSFAARLGLAFGAVYYYNTSQLFAEEPPFSIPPPQEPTQETSLHTLESIAQRNRTPPPPTPALTPAPLPENASAKSKPPANEYLAPSNDTTNPLPPANEALSSSPVSGIANPNRTPPASEGLEATEAEAHQEGAFNEETGEINWDCPCLGGMAHGPCGEQFREAFSCFVYSKEEPKGMDCIPKFKNMQDCFREHPDVYGAELEDDEGPESEDAPAPVSVEGGEVPAAALSTDPASTRSPSSLSASSSTARENTQIGSIDEGNDLVPKASHDATDANPEEPSKNSAPAPSPSSQSPPSASSSTAKEDTQLGSTDEGSVLVPKAAHDATDANTEK